MTDGRQFAVFDTAIGRCAVAWGPGGIVGVQLPEGSERATRARIAKRFPDVRDGKPPPAVKRAIRDMAALLDGKKADLSRIALDMDGVPEFHRCVYEAARMIPAGATLSYGEVAKRAGAPGAARAVGQALGRNPFAIVVPCHRVLAAGGKLGGFSANGGVSTKARMLEIEGARASEAPSRAPATAAGLDFDPRVAVKHLRAADDVLARIIDAVGPLGIELKKTRTLFGALAEAIVYQQLSGKAAATIYSRVRGLFPGSKDGPTPRHILSATDAQLRSAGLSRAKAAALRDLARHAQAGEIPSLAAARRMGDEEIVERVTRVRGIGRWTAEMLLIFRLGRGDVLPVHDYGVRKGFAFAYGKRKLPAPKALEKHGARWRPYRTAASWYLWRALDLPKK
jgi:methylated-DNA-[protein]-cysteine S-methyltransferase